MKILKNSAVDLVVPIISIRYFFLLFSILITSACSSAETNHKYNQFYVKLTYPDEKWSPNDFGRPSTNLELNLLKKHSPRFWISNKSCFPMNFYKQYVPLLTATGKKDNIIKASRKNLKIFERNFTINWKLKKYPKCIQSKNPPLYSYSWTEKMKLPSGGKEDIRILKYAFSFYKSGMPAKQTFLQTFGRVLGDPNTVHYLDIHGAIFYLLNSKNEIFAVVLAQHNHFRSFIIGKDISETNAKKICFANRSNEPYFCGKNEGPFKFPTAPTYKDIRWIITNKNKPFFGAWDLIPAPLERKEIQYKLEFLRSKDPLITSWVPLGPEIKIWGVFSSFYKNSPPGMAIYNTPQLKELWKTAQYFYFDADSTRVFDLHEKNAKDFFHPNITPVFKINSIRFEKALTTSQY